MTTKRYTLIYGLLITIWMFLVSAELWAQEPCTSEFAYNCTNTEVALSNTIGGPILSSEGSNSLGLGFGGSSVTPVIRDCIFTEYDSYFIFWDKQRGKENKHCLAMQEHLIGNHNTEARIKCKDTSIANLYGSFDECTEAQEEHVTNSPKKPKNSKDADEVTKITQFQEVQQQFQMADTRYSELAAKFDQMESYRQASVRRAAENREYARATYEQVKQVVEND